MFAAKPATATGTHATVPSRPGRSALPFLACPATGTQLTGESCSEFPFRTTATSAMMARAGARYIIEEVDIGRVALLGNDYTAGREWVENYRQTLTAGNVDVTVEQFVPLANERWDGVLEQVRDAGVDGIVGAFIPQSQASFLRAFLAGGYGAQFLSHFWSAEGLGGLGSALEASLGSDFTARDVREANVGPFVTRYHWNQFDNPVNEWFVETHTDVYGTLPDTFTGSAFAAGSALGQVAEEQGGLTSDAVVNGLGGMAVGDTPKGSGGYSFQEFNNQARSDVTVAPIVPTDRDDWEASIRPGDPLFRVAGSEAALPQSSVSCRLR